MGRLQRAITAGDTEGGEGTEGFGQQDWSLQALSALPALRVQGPPELPR
jgi:hypothetical protein